MNQSGGVIIFQNSAKARVTTVYTIGKDAHFETGSALTTMEFLDHSSADHAKWVVISSQLFFVNSTADHAMITCTQGIYPGGELWFMGDQSTAANAKIIIEGAAHADSTEGSAFFEQSATAGNANLIVNGGFGRGRRGTLSFSADSTAGASSITVNGGSDGGGGEVAFVESATGGTARIALIDDGIMDISHREGTQEVTIGSLEGNGDVFLQENMLIVGSNDLTQTFSGRIRRRAERIGAKGILKKVGKVR
jgi:hypothetical protein